MVCKEEDTIPQVGTVKAAGSGSWSQPLISTGWVWGIKYQLS